MPSGLREYPQTDCNGRSTGRLITNSNGEKQFGEYLYYRKVGDHATNMPSSIYFGERKNGAYEIKDNIKYAYDSVGNITEIRENGALSARYEYDLLNRLVREDNKTLGKTTTITYDTNGNILSKREYAFTLCDRKELDERTELKSMQYAYCGDKLMHLSVTDASGTRDEYFSYDAIGNPVLYRGENATWTRGRLLSKLGENTFAYRADGRRYQRNGISYTYSSEGRLLSSTDGMQFVYGTQGVVGFAFNGENYHYRRDALGNIVAILDNNGTVVVNYVYDAWGNHVVLDASGHEISNTEHIGRRNPFRYRGYYYDEATKLYFLQTRYYDPEIGRFITIDSVSYLDPDSINGINLYAYCGNNPVMNLDPTGTFNWKKFWGGFAIVAATAVAVALTVVTFGSGSVAGAIIIGATIGFASELFSQTIVGDATLAEVNWGQVAVSTIAGATSAIPGVGLGVASAISGVAVGINTWIAGGSMEDAITRGAIAAASSLVFGSILRAVGIGKMVKISKGSYAGKKVFLKNTGYSSLAKFNPTTNKSTSMIRFIYDNVGLRGFSKIAANAAGWKWELALNILSYVPGFIH